MKINNCLIIMGLIIFLLIILNISYSNKNKVNNFYRVKPFSLSRQFINSNQFLSLNNDIETFLNKDYITRNQCIKSVTETCDKLTNKNGLIKVSDLPDFYQGQHTEEEEYYNKNYNFNNNIGDESCKPCS